MTTGIPYRTGSPSVFEWDEAKRTRNIAKHGIDFVAAVHVFGDSRRIERIDRRRHYGEERRQMIGAVRRDVLFVAYTIRDGAIRIISARRASKDERKAYYAGRVEG